MDVNLSAERIHHWESGRAILGLFPANVTSGHSRRENILHNWFCQERRTKESYSVHRKDGEASHLRCQPAIAQVEYQPSLRMPSKRLQVRQCLTMLTLLAFHVSVCEGAQLGYTVSNHGPCWLIDPSAMTPDSTTRSRSPASPNILPIVDSKLDIEWMFPIKSFSVPSLPPKGHFLMKMTD